LLVIRNGRLVAAGTEEELTGRLSGAHKVQALVRGDRARAKEVVTQIEGISSCTAREAPLLRATALGGVAGRGAPAVEAEGKDKGAVYQLIIEADRDLREEISRALVQADLGLLQLSPAEAELESIFLELTQTKEVPQ
jgi:ABC-type multidrug transport system ATPase subunit